MSVRAYLPVTEDDLAALVDSGRLAGPRRGHAVTAGLRAGWPDGDDESWEYAALMAAAADCRADGAPTARRRVLAVDVPSAEPLAGDDPTAVEVAADVTLRDVAALHVDTEDGADDEDDLAWFATQEIAALLHRGM